MAAQSRKTRPERLASGDYRWVVVRRRAEPNGIRQVHRLHARVALRQIRTPSVRRGPAGARTVGRLSLIDRENDDMLGQRKVDETPANHFRSERISVVNGRYFFSTREGTLEGPFFSKQDAEREVTRYLARHECARNISEYKVLR